MDVIRRGRMSRIGLLVLLAAGLCSASLAHADASDFPPGRDPLATPEMRRFAPGAVRLGWAYVEKGDLETALSRFEMAVRHDSTFAPGWFGIAYVYSLQDRLDDAILNYRHSLAHDTTCVYTYANLGYALLQKDRIPEALDLLRHALRIDPNCGEAHVSLANYYARNGQWERAERSANRGIECGQDLDPEFRKILTAHGVHLVAAKSAGRER